MQTASAISNSLRINDKIYESEYVPPEEFVFSDEDSLEVVNEKKQKRKDRLYE